MPMNLTRDDERRIEGIRKRLGAIAQRYSQAEIARRTGASRSNVSRYLRGTRLPADFTTALTEKLNVNAEWLLTGSGAPWVEEIPPNTMSLAGDLLELIKSMIAVEHMQLGALAGNHHLRVLRDLGDAMTRYEVLREQLNKRSAPVLAKVLDQLRAALDVPDFDRADELARTAQQLGRLCDDQDLSLDLAVLCGRFATMASSTWAIGLDEVARMQRRVATLALNSGEGLSGKRLEALAVATVALNHMGRVDEALRTAKAGLLQATGDAVNSYGFRKLQLEMAHSQIMVGQLQPALEIVSRLQEGLPDLDNDRARATLTYLMLAGGMIEMRSAVGIREKSPWSAIFLLGFASVSEREEDLKQALSYWDREHKYRDMHDGPGLRRWAALLLEAQAGKGAKTVAAAREFVESMAFKSPNLACDMRPIIATQIYRCVGATEEARRNLNKSERMLAAVPGWFCIPAGWHARHNRNRLALGTKAQQKAARALFRQQVENGFRCFQPLLDEA